ncbi:acyl-CoA dehydrogenase [Thalassobaculum fulvum]|uniref:Acyl-CoA dehydrogenase n=1 Tax=Thalassobaculum fulvum TaxID=1633335 RepID=A0A918XST4_9PROT|nr:acyl-CoA dehydrogenase family protein [Thalassobaculum fulvum]GHD49251.1 acyl-CoA dehydrogenase [Thalassobaculum fulvum]
MSFAFTEDQQLLAESADRFLADKYDFDARKAIRRGEDGWSREMWAAFAELGWLALPLPEEHGGLGGSTVDVAVLMERFGRHLVVEPFVATVVLGAEAIVRAGSDVQKAAILPAVAEGGMLLAFGVGEPQARFDLHRVATAARRDGGGWKLAGHKAVVLHADAADRLILSARTSGAEDDRDGITLFLVDPKADGVTLRPYPTVDGLRGAEVLLDGVSVGEADIVGGVGAGLPVIEAVIDRAMVLLSAESVGAMAETVRLTTEYLKTRVQFGQPLSSFQVLQHRLVEMLQAKEFAHALCYRAAGAMDTTDGVERARAAAGIKAEAGRAGKMIGQEAIQLHGGMGMTDEMAIGHYFKRMTMIDVQFGNAAHHLRRFATLS